MTKTQSILLTLIVYKVVLTPLEIRSRHHGLFLAMLAGFSLTVIRHWLPDVPESGDAAERLVPMLASGLTAFTTRRKGDMP
ncbi:MAG: hypothetical protein AMJ59_05300 [Gammaproteobacteria bacterium SG8_31]|jgi:hypothetical protein|nr:MAG: hypothetical protein AMJ59_05300 [Gammaproteobacteria bacterium SG8_31]